MGQRRGQATENINQMNYQKKHSPEAKGARPPSPQAAKPAQQFKPAVCQRKTTVSSQSSKRPVAPPAYRPQTKAIAAQAKMDNASRSKVHLFAPAVSTSSRPGS